MNTLINILITIIGLLHLYILVLEMFLWTKPKGLKTFGKTLEEAKQSAALAANQGLYNGFLAAGLFWSLIVKNAHTALHFKVFFLACVAVAGVYGGFTSSRKIMVVQTLPALIALSLLIYNC